MGLHTGLPVSFSCLYYRTSTASGALSSHGREQVCISPPFQSLPSFMILT